MVLVGDKQDLSTVHPFIVALQQSVVNLNRNGILSLSRKAIAINFISQSIGKMGVPQQL